MKGVVGTRHLLPFGARLPDWWDVYVFDDAPTITCPDCDEQSPELRDLLAAAVWCDQHKCLDPRMEKAV